VEKVIALATADKLLPAHALTIPAAASTGMSCDISRRVATASCRSTCNNPLLALPRVLPWFPI